MPCQEFYCLDDQDYWMNIRSYTSLKDSLYEILVCLFKTSSIECRRTNPTSFYCTSTFAFTNIYSNFVFTKVDSLLLFPQISEFPDFFKFSMIKIRFSVFQQKRNMWKPWSRPIQYGSLKYLAC